MTSLGMFSYYKQWAYKIFNYLQPRICKYTKCNLEIFYMNQLNGVAFGTISRPNTIMIYIDNAVSYVGNENNVNAVVSMLFIILSHELHHVEQEVNQNIYTSDLRYHVDLEFATESMSFEFLKSNKNIIDRDFGIDLDLSYYDGYITMKQTCNYYSLEMLYKSIIANTVLRNWEGAYIEIIKDIDSNSDVFVQIGDSPNLLIKSNGEYMQASYQNFVDAVSANAARFDSYTVRISTEYTLHRGNTKALLVRFRILDKTLYPMQFDNPNGFFPADDGDSLPAY